jgi:hypothetical protein
VIAVAAIATAHRAGSADVPGDLRGARQVMVTVPAATGEPAGAEREQSVQPAGYARAR